MVFRRVSEVQARLLSSNKIYEGLIKEDDVFEKILRVFDFNFIYDEVKDCYCLNNGRPCEDPVRLFKASLVQRLKGLSDVEMEYAARYDLRIKHFLGIPIQDYGFDYSTLSLFRKRLGIERFEKIFQKILGQIVKLGVIKNPDCQFIDSMPVLAHAALPSVTCLIYQAVKNVVKKLEDEVKKEVYGKTGLTDRKLEFYSKPRALFKMEKAGRKKVFEKVVNRAKEMVQYLESKEYESGELDLLKQVLNENVSAEGQQVQTPKAIKTLVDKDAKLGRKTKEDLIFGYKNNSTVTEEGIVTAVEVTSAAEKDDKQTGKLIGKQVEAGLKANVLEGDSGYGYIETFKTAEEKGVELNAPYRGLKEEGQSTYELDYDKKTNTITCLNDISIQGTSKDGLLFEFPIRKCRDCPRKKRCNLPASKRIRLHPDHEIARKAIKRQRQKTEAKKLAKAKGQKTKSRLIIENVYAYLEKLGGKKTPYTNLARSAIHVLLVATISNIMKTIRLIG